MVVSNIYHVHSIWGRVPFWLILFQLGWFNYHLVIYLIMFQVLFSDGRKGHWGSTVLGNSQLLQDTCWYPRLPNTLWEGIWTPKTYLKHLLRRYLEAWGIYLPIKKKANIMLIQIYQLDNFFKFRVGHWSYYLQRTLIHPCSYTYVNMVELLSIENSASP